jgi:hypothetical protein
MPPPISVSGLPEGQTRKSKGPDWLLSRQVLQRIATGMSLVSEAIGWRKLLLNVLSEGSPAEPAGTLGIGRTAKLVQGNVDPLILRGRAAANRWLYWVSMGHLKEGSTL